MPFSKNLKIRDIFISVMILKMKFVMFIYRNTLFIYKNQFNLIIELRRICLNLATYIFIVIYFYNYFYYNWLTLYNKLFVLIRILIVVRVNSPHKNIVSSMLYMMYLLKYNFCMILFKNPVIKISDRSLENY